MHGRDHCPLVCARIVDFGGLEPLLAVVAAERVHEAIQRGHTDVTTAAVHRGDLKVRLVVTSRFGFSAGYTYLLPLPVHRIERRAGVEILHTVVTANAVDMLPDGNNPVIGAHAERVFFGQAHPSIGTRVVDFNVRARLAPGPAADEDYDIVGQARNGQWRRSEELLLHIDRVQIGHEGQCGIDNRVAR